MTFFSIIFFAVINFFIFGNMTDMCSTIQHGRFQHRSPYETTRYSALFWPKMEFFNRVCNDMRGVQNTHHVKQTRVAHAVLIVPIVIAAFMFMFLARSLMFPRARAQLNILYRATLMLKQSRSNNGGKFFQVLVVFGPISFCAYRRANGK